MRYADRARGGLALCFRIRRSWRHQSRRSARRARCGGRLIRRSRYCRVGRRSAVALFLQPALSASSAVQPAASASHRWIFLFSLFRNAPGFDQDDAAGLDAFDCHLLEKRTLLEAAACYRRTHPPDVAIRAAYLSLRQAVESAMLMPAVPASQRRPVVPAERPLPATPAVGSYPSESTVPTLRLLRRRRTPAHTAPVCLLCPTSRASARLSLGPSPPSHCIAAAPPYLLDAVFKLDTAMQHSNRLWPGPA